jgi:hypothetical protein
MLAAWVEHRSTIPLKHLQNSLSTEYGVFHAQETLRAGGRTVDYLFYLTRKFSIV